MALSINNKHYIITGIILGIIILIFLIRFVNLKRNKDIYAESQEYKTLLNLREEAMKNMDKLTT